MRRRSRRNTVTDIVRRELGLSHDLLPDVLVDFNRPEQMVEVLLLYWRKWFKAPYDFRIPEAEDTFNAILGTIGIGPPTDTERITVENSTGRTIILNFSSYLYPAGPDFDNLVWRYMTEVDSMSEETDTDEYDLAHAIAELYVPLSRATTERMQELRETDDLPIITKTKFLQLLTAGFYSIPELNGNDVFLVQAIQANDPILVHNYLNRCVEQYRFAMDQQVFYQPHRKQAIQLQCSELAFYCATIQTPDIDFDEFATNPNHSVAWIGECLRLHVRQLFQTPFMPSSAA